MAKNSQSSGYNLPQPVGESQNTESDQANGFHDEAGTSSVHDQNYTNEQNSNGESSQEMMGATESSISVDPGFYPEEQPDTTTRDFSIGFGILIVLMIAFWFVKNAYSNALVAKRITPRSANTAGLCLWLFLTTLSAGSILCIINPDKFITVNYMAPLGVLGVIFIVLMFITGRR